MIQEAGKELISTNRYIVRLSENIEDIYAAQRLRFKVFNLELGEGLSSAYEQERDIDIFDDQCDHLLVAEKETGKIIGTYRMQDYKMADNGHGFYTSNEFNLEAIPEGVLKEAIEVGRACIHKEHRNGRVLYLLWRGIAEYMKIKQAGYLFGCCSLTSQNPREAWQVMKYLENTNHLHSSIRVETKPDYACPEISNDVNYVEEVKLPQLFRLYLDLRAKVCSGPALDTEFKTIDYLILLDVEKLDERTKLLFFK